METKDRIKIVIEHTKLKKQDFAKKLDITPTYVSELLRGKYAPSLKLIKNISSTFNINEEWLITGKGQMQKEFISDNARVLEFLGKIGRETDSGLYKFVDVISKLSEESLQKLNEIMKELLEKKED